LTKKLDQVVMKKVEEARFSKTDHDRQGEFKQAQKQAIWLWQAKEGVNY